MATKDIDARIDDLCTRRSELWAAGDGEATEELASIAAKLTALYEEKRTAAAGAGTPRTRKKAMDRARAEDELARLMSS